MMARFATATKGNLRNKIGSSQMAELPPALIILFVLVFFPLLDLVYVFVAYCGGWYLNQMEMRQVACQTPQNLTPPAQGKTSYTSSTYTPQSRTPINLSVSQSWNGFLGVIESSESPSVTYLPNPLTPTVNQIYQAQVTTTVSVNPFLSQTNSWLPKVPGLNEPLNFVYTNTIFQEEQTP